MVKTNMASWKIAHRKYTVFIHGGFSSQSCQFSGGIKPGLWCYRKPTLTREKNAFKSKVHFQSHEFAS